MCANPKVGNISKNFADYSAQIGPCVSGATLTAGLQSTTLA
jgi:hypothetical protein